MVELRTPSHQDLEDVFTIVLHPANQSMLEVRVPHVWVGLEGGRKERRKGGGGGRRGKGKGDTQAQVCHNIGVAILEELLGVTAFRGAT
jgi:hypothetical protein